MLPNDVQAAWDAFLLPYWECIIQPGLDKIEEYQAHLVDTPAYVLAMGETSIFQWIAYLILILKTNSASTMSNLKRSSI